MTHVDTMGAVVVGEFGDADVLDYRPNHPMPRPSAGQVSIDVRGAGVNLLEVLSRRFGYLGVRPPFVPGLEVAGTVRELGRGVTGLAISGAMPR